MSKDLVTRLWQYEIVKRGSFILKSGEKSDIYVDLKKLVSMPCLLKDVCKEISNLFFTSSNQHNLIVSGVPMGGIALSIGISLLFNIPSIFIRDKVKDHGTQKRIEGDPDPSRELILIEDVITTGSSVENVLNILKEEGLTVSKIVCVIDRQRGGVEHLQALGYDVECLLKLDNFK